MAREKLVRIYEVLFDDHSNPYGGAAGNGTFVERFRKQAAAEAFAATATAYGRPAVARLAEVPARLASRWSIVG